MNESVHHDRYPGARPFMDMDIDRRLFFGRDREINELFYQVMGSRLLVLFGKSGLGKTSLLQAGMFPRLREQDLLPLPVRLNRTDLPPLALFTIAIAEACEQSGIDYTPGERGSLWEFFKTAVFWRGEALQTPVLVLDQFEEIFTLQSVAHRQWIIRQLGELVGDGLPKNLRVRLQTGEKLLYSEKPPTVKIILSLREDYLGALQELSGEIPRILENRFHLTALSKEQARLAVVEPAKLPQEGMFSTRPFHYEGSVVEDLLTFLGSNTREIEPSRLQILCRHVERQVAEAQAKDQADIRVNKEYLGDWMQMEVIPQKFYEEEKRNLLDKETRDHFISSSPQRMGMLRKSRAKWWVPISILTVLAGLTVFESKRGLLYYPMSSALKDTTRLTDTRRAPSIHYYEDQGDRLFAQGNLKGAYEVYKNKLALAKQATRQEPDNPQWQRDLAVSYKRIGDVQKARGDRAGALASYQKSLKITKALVARDPSNTEWQRDLAVSYEKIGDVQKAKGDLAGALASYQSALKITEADLALSFYKLASLENTSSASGRQKARNLYEQSLTILRRLDAEGRLPPNRKEWIGIIEKEMKALGN